MNGDGNIFNHCIWCLFMYWDLWRILAFLTLVASSMMLLLYLKTLQWSIHCRQGQNQLDLWTTHESNQWWAPFDGFSGCHRWEGFLQIDSFVLFGSISDKSCFPLVDLPVCHLKFAHHSLHNWKNFGSWWNWWPWHQLPDLIFSATLDWTTFVIALMNSTRSGSLMDSL